MGRLRRELSSARAAALDCQEMLEELQAFSEQLQQQHTSLQDQLQVLNESSDQLSFRCMLAFPDRATVSCAVFRSSRSGMAGSLGLLKRPATKSWRACARGLKGTAAVHRLLVQLGADVRDIDALPVWMTPGVSNSALLW